MKAALHRSLTFWFGLLAMGFICWAWWDSLREGTRSNTDRFWLEHSWSGLTIHRLSASHPPVYGFRRERHIPAALKHPPERLPPPVFLRNGDMSVEEQNALADRFWELNGNPISFTRREALRWQMCLPPPRDWIAFIPHWLVLLTVAALWLGLLFWRARRRAKATGHPDPGEAAGNGHPV